MDNLAFVFSDDSDSSKLAYYKKLLQRDDSWYVESEEVTIPVESSRITSAGPMDSPWPMKCHDLHHTSRSQYSTAENPGDEIWRFETDGWVEDGSTIDSDGTIYFGGNYGGLPWYLFAIYPNGTLKWMFKTDYLLWGSCPAIAEDGTIYVGSWDAKLYAITPNGTLKWKIGVGGNVASSPAIAEDGTIYVGAMGPGNKGRVTAVNPNGTRKWEYDTGYWIASDPAIGDDSTIYIGSGDSYLYALYPNGTLRWRFKTNDEIHSHPSIAEDGTIYIGSNDDWLYAIYPNNGTMKWKFSTNWGAYNSASIGEDGIIYVGTDWLYAAYPNGTEKWRFNLGTDRWIGSSSPAISADGTIYVGTHIGSGGGGDIIAVNPDGTEKWRKTIANNWIESSPCIGEDGTVYIGSSSDDAGDSYGYLHAFNRGELEADADCSHYGLINEPMQFSGSATGGYPPYLWDWDFGDGNSSDEQNPTHTYTYPDNFTVTLTVTDNSSNTSDDTTWAWIQASNDPPDKPSIDGKINGTAGVSYPYTFETNDPEGLQVWYYIEWGDDSNTGWLGPYSSGEQITKSHTWSEKDTYTIRCKAKDPYEAESEWGELEVTMPMNQQSNSWWFLQFLQNHPRMFPRLNQIIYLLMERLGV